MPKTRIQIPEGIAASVLVASDHTCCKCEQRVAPVQIHHIDDNPANNDVDNLAVLCLICHNETQIRGGFSRQLTPASVKLYRDQWVVRVRKRKAAADALFLEAAAGRRHIQRTPKVLSGDVTASDLSVDEIETYIETLPDILGAAYQQVSRDWHGNTMDMVRAAYSITEVVKQMWLQLAHSFPRGNFRGQTINQYLDEFLESRYSWQGLMAEPHGPGTGGTVAGILVARGVLRDLELAVVDLRDAAKGLAESHKARNEWLQKWERATRKYVASRPFGHNGNESDEAASAEPIRDARLAALAQGPEFFDFVAAGRIVRILARQLHNTTGGQTTYALCQQMPDGTEAIFDTIEGHHLSLFADDVDGDGTPEAIILYHCGGHTMVMNVYRVQEASTLIQLIPGGSIGSDWPEIRWDKSDSEKGFVIRTRDRNWSGIPSQEYVESAYSFVDGKCVKTN